MGIDSNTHNDIAQQGCPNGSNGVLATSSWFGNNLISINLGL
jgi:hypothetical protein